MGLISGAIDSAFESIGTSMLNGGEWFIQAGYKMWQQCSSITLTYVERNPMSQASAWGIVTGGIFTISMAVAASLSVLFFVLGWLRESIDIRNTFTLENMFRVFIRYAITASLIVNSLSVVTAITQCASAVVSTISVETSGDDMKGAFDELKETLEKDDEADGGTYLAYGFCGLIGGLIGGMVIIVCGVSIVLAVLSRLFKLLLCIPFAPVAFAGFAGGGEFSQSGIAWIRTFIGYALEAVVIALAITISFGLFKDASLFSTGSKDTGVVAMVLMICEYCMPMITASACVKGAEITVRRCLGLG